jgi:uncharacterized protein
VPRSQRAWPDVMTDMGYSKFNIFSKIRDSENYFIVNLLSGSADILEPPEAEKLKEIKDGGNPDDPDFLDELSEKGYLADESAENAEYRRKYLDFLDSRENEEIQIFFVTNYSCNFSCSYCYQDQYNNPGKELNTEIIDAFFEHVRKTFSKRKKYITIFGGEPLLNSADQRGKIEYIIEKAVSENLKLCLVTNGYFLEEYIPLLKKAEIREIQVTLDGTADVHNKRRHLRNGAGTFEKVVRGIDSCLANGLSINLRIVVDRDNIGNLPELAQFAIKKGWTSSSLFKTQLGRNYELHHCQADPDRLFDRVSLWEEIYSLNRRYPFIEEFYKPAYSVARFLSENGELPDPLFDSCPACKSEWAFDYLGNIYSCTATVGKSDERLGTFWPLPSLDNEAVENWENRDVTSISECNNCNLRLTCGGGCGAVAKNRTGSVSAPDCRPVRELLELGFSVLGGQQ